MSLHLCEECARQCQCSAGSALLERLGDVISQNFDKNENRGTSTVLVGTNGIGKTTLINNLLRISEASQVSPRIDSAWTWVRRGTPAIIPIFEGNSLDHIIFSCLCMPAVRLCQGVR